MPAPDLFHRRVLPWPQFVLGTALLLLWPRAARTEDAVAYKFQSWQEDAGRIRVDAHYALAEKNLGVDTYLRLTGVIDTIVGATPTGEPPPPGSDQVPLAFLEDRREAWQVDLSHQFPRINVTGAFASSRESDYISKSYTLNALVDFNQKATTLLLGASRADDDVAVAFFTTPRAKRTTDVIVGLTQLLDARTSLSVNLTHGRSEGYLSDPYKIVLKTVELLPGLTLPLTFPENRPDEKDRWILYGSLNRRLTRVDAAVEVSWRWLHDSFGLTSHTLAAEYFHRIGSRLIVRPALRFYQQTAADFYYARLDQTAITPSGQPTGAAPFYSSDHRLSALRTWTPGLKIVWEIAHGWSADATYERYIMQGRDDLTSASAFVDADVFTVGVKWSR